MTVINDLYLGLAEEMFEDGYEHSTSVDISFTVIKQMQEMYKEKIPTLAFKQMDVRSLQYEDGTFDAVIDKGTLDSVLCGDGSGPNADAMLAEIYRVLSPTGVYICITYGLPDQRQDYFRKPEFFWNMSTHKVTKPTISTSTVVANEDKNEKNFHYIFVLRKQVDKDKQ